MDCTEICFNQSEKIIVQEIVALTWFKNWQGSDACLSKIKPQYATKIQSLQITKAFPGIRIMQENFKYL